MKSSSLLEGRRRYGRTAIRLLLFGLLVPPVLAAASSVPAAPMASSSPFASSRPSNVYEVRSIPTREFGLRHPAGLAYVPTDGSLVLAGSEGERTRLVRMSRYEDLVGSLRVQKLSSQSSLTFDPTNGNLAAFAETGQLELAMPGDRKASSHARRAAMGQLTLADPRAAVFDPKRNAWYVLDGRDGSLVRVSTSGRARARRITLDVRGARSLRGLAYNPADGLLYVTSPADARLYALDGSGRVRKIYSLKELALRNARAILFAPSADPTDAAAAQHLYIADAGSSSVGGRIVEATLAPEISFAATTVAGTWIQTIHTSAYSPPSPDPAGIDYVSATDQFLIGDSEVDEMTIYQGKNLFTATRSGSGTGTGTSLPWSQEPTGLGHDPSSNTLYVSDDDRDRIFIVRPGADGHHGTADDVVSFFSTSAFGSGDAEGVEYDAATGHVFISDGVALEVYEIDPVNSVFGDGNDIVTHFDIGQYGARDAEGIGIDPQRGLLLVVDPSTKSIYELTKTGTLVRIIDCRGIPTTNRAYASVTMAPTSNPNDPPSTLDYWIVDRQVDNGSDPNENDGKLYEVSAPPTADTPPTVSVTVPAEGATVSGTTTVAANASDDVGVTQVAFKVDGAAIGTDVNGADGWSVPWNTTTVSDGTRSVTATATDTLGQTASDSNGVFVDNTPPAVAVTSPTEGATVSGTITVQANASDARGVTQVVFSIDGTDIGTDTNGTNGWSMPWNTTTVANGAHTVTATATDTTGHTASDSNSVTVNNVVTSPVVTITAPAEGAVISGSVVVSASAVSGTSITQVAFSVDGANIGTDTNGADGWSVSWNTTTVADGAHTLAATATDTLGQTGSDSNGVTVDNTDPTVSLTAPSDGTTVSGTIALQAGASDARGVSQVAFSVDGTVVGTDTNGSNGWSVSWNTTTVPDGTHVVTATATDAAGNTGNSSNTVTVDNTAPTVNLTAPTGGQTVSGTIALEATASDASGVSQVTFSVDGTVVGTDTNGSNGWSVSWNTATVADGAHTVTATAADPVGNAGADSKSVTVDNAAPVVILVSPAEGADVSGTIVLQATTSDASGVTQVEFAVDGTSIGTDTNGADGWTLPWNTTSAPDGPHSVSATATDTIGSTASDSNNVTVDNTSPTVSIVAPAPGAVVEATITVEALATDAGSVASVQFFANGTSLGTDTNGADGWSRPWNTTTMADGPYDLTATARDAAGNAATSAAVQVTVDNPTLVVLNRPIGVGVDDADEVQSGSVRRSNGDLELGTDQGVPTTVGLRFTQLAIPQGATITNAYVQFTTDENGKAATSLVVRAEAADTAAAITTAAFNISSRPRTTASTAWSPARWQGVGTAGPAQQTPDLSAVIQEVVNRPAWASGNALMVVVTGSGRRTAESFEGGFAPVLHVEYTAD